MEWPSIIDEIEADLDARAEAEFELDHFQSGKEDTVWGRYLSTANRLRSAREAATWAQLDVDENREKLEALIPGTAEYRRHQWVANKAQRRVEKFKAHVRKLLDTAKQLRSQLPDVRDPDVRYQLDRELMFSRMKRKLFLDWLAADKPSSGFFQSLRHLPVEDRRSLLDFARNAPPEVKRMALDAWLFEDRCDFLPSERRDMLSSPVDDPFRIGASEDDWKSLIDSDANAAREDEPCPLP